MSYEDELIQRMEREGGHVRSETARRAHYLKMAAAGGLMAVCFGLFAFGVLGGKRGLEQAHALTAAKQGKHVDVKTAGERMAVATGPELAALLLGSASGIYFLFLMMRLRRLD